MHLFAVFCKTTTWNEEIQGSAENVSPRRWIFSLYLYFNSVPTNLVKGYFALTLQRERHGIIAKQFVARYLDTLLNSYRFPSFLGRLIYRRLVLLLGTVYCSVSLTYTRCFSWFRCTTINLLRTSKAVIYFAQQRNVSIFTDFGQYYLSPIFRQFIQW